MKQLLRNTKELSRIAGAMSAIAWLSGTALAQEPKTEPTTPAKTIQIRGKTALVQELVMAPEAYELWQKIQQMIENPELKEFSRLVETFELQIKEPVDAVHWETMRTGLRTDIRGKGHVPMIKAGRYSIGGVHPPPNIRRIRFEMQFDTTVFCLSKREIQRLYKTGFESAPTHSPNWFFQDHTGYSHGFGLIGEKGGGFGVSPNGCASDFVISQNLQN